LGQLIQKEVGNRLQTVDYRYNIRGWLTDINDVQSLDQEGQYNDLFAFKINYNTLTGDIEDQLPNVKQLYNGNIAETFWRSSSDNVLRKYSYQYDTNNRLRGAFYQKPEASVSLANTYDETMEYDANGNITNLIRSGNGDNQYGNIVIDDLKYSYDYTNKGNKLLNVKDFSNSTSGFKDGTNAANVNDYSYDAFGNMTHDANKDIESITYNHLNLPVYIDFLDIGKITYIYNALGQKVMKIVEDTNTGKIVTTDYPMARICSTVDSADLQS
jgi:hypothetical protein